MRNIFRSLFFILLVFSFSCEEQGWFVNCSDCEAEEPQEASLHLKLTETEIPSYIVVYDGELGDSIVYNYAYSRGPEYNFPVSLNKLYTITARYTMNGVTYTAVDSATPRVRYAKDECDDPCYFVYDREVNLRLKYRAY
jgi:hypothetical protein